MKISSVLIILIASMLTLSCSVNNKQLSKNNSEVYDTFSFNYWVSERKHLLLLTAHELERYFEAEKILFHKKNILGDEINTRIEFLSDLKMYSEAAPISKLYLANKIQIDEAQVQLAYKNLYEKNRNLKKKHRIYQFYKKYPFNSDQNLIEDLYNKVADFKKGINSLEDFKIIANRYSDSQTRLTNGLIGNVAYNHFNEPLNSIIMNLKAGEMTEIIKTKEGFFIFYCEKVILPNFKSESQLLNSATNKIKRELLDKKWFDHKSEIIKEQDIHINPEVLQNNQSDRQVVISARDFELTLKQLKWIQNGMNLLQDQKFNGTAFSKLQLIAENFAVNYVLYHQLKKERQNSLYLNRNFNLFNTTLQQVIAKLVSDNIKVPSENETYQYYHDNKSDFTHETIYQISAIALNSNNKDKVEKYRHAESILNSLKAGHITFELASSKHSYLDKRFPGGKLTPVAFSQLASRFGINVKKQLDLLEINEISKLIETATGDIWIVRINDIKKPSQMSFKEARTQAHNILGTQRARLLEKEIYQNILESID
jgi:hypothetical protein